MVDNGDADMPFHNSTHVNQKHADKERSQGALFQFKFCGYFALVSRLINGTSEMPYVPVNVNTVSESSSQLNSGDFKFVHSHAIAILINPTE